MADVTWLASTNAKADAGELVGDEKLRIVSDPSGTPVTRSTTANSIAKRLTAARTYYVRVGGSDSNDGLTTGNAFLTVQHAVDVAMMLAPSKYLITIDIGAGDFTGSKVYIQSPHAGFIEIKGAGNTVTAIGGGASDHGVQVDGPATVTLRDVRIEGSLRMIWGRFGATFQIRGTVRLGRTGVAYDYGIILDNASAYVDSGCELVFNESADVNLIAVTANSYLVAASSTLSTSKAITNGNQTVLCESSTVVFVSGNTTWDVSSGAITGTRYRSTFNGSIKTFAGGGSYIPGTVAGTTDNGGVYA